MKKKIFFESMIRKGLYKPRAHQVEKGVYKYKKKGKGKLMEMKQ